MTIQWPLDSVQVTGEFANSPWYYQQFGQRGHNGIDLAAKVGTPVYAADDGTVDAEGWGNYDNWMGSIAGIFVRIRHAWGYTAYAHLSTTVVNAGQRVSRGQLIGYSGATGVGTGPHLHFETFPLYPNFANGFAGRVNPRAFGLVQRGASNAQGADDMPLNQNDLNLIYKVVTNVINAELLDKPVARQGKKSDGSPQSGNTTLRAWIGWLDHAFAQTRRGIVADVFARRFKRGGRKADGTPQTGETDLGSVVAWFDHAFSSVIARIDKDTSKK